MSIAEIISVILFILVMCIYIFHRYLSQSVSSSYPSRLYWEWDTSPDLAFKLCQFLTGYFIAMFF